MMRNAGGKEVALVGLAELFASPGKGRAGKAGCDEVHAPVRLRVEGGDVAFKHAPLGPAMAQRAASVRVDLDQRGVLEPGLLQAQRHSARAGA